jgi:DNA-binding transcriptional MerR regulator
VSERLLSIGDLSARTGVAVTALRYYDELGLVTPCTRVSGQRRYPDAAVRAVGLIILLREIGFSLAEIAEMTAITARTDRWAELIDDKLAEITEQQHRLTVARTALEHARDCPAEHPSRCPRFWAIIDARLEGTALEAAHAEAG